MERDKEELLNLKEKLANVCESEKELWFRSFGNREEWELGSMLVIKDKKENYYSTKCYVKELVEVKP